MESPVLVRVEPGALVHGGGAAAMVTEEVVQRTLGMFAGPGLSVQSGEVMQTCVLELETKVHTKVRNHGEGPYEGLLLVESAYQR